ncbi:MAG: hydrogen peroxide-inducible genes activator [Pseudobdellovibrionaceae bacterium]|jgi:LysR family hydrogen peroxide-inducible transcriptional activator|nr:hydrogen peroxide-inducible genes activator [Pseudobdellovibrionaceae bacterium]
MKLPSARQLQYFLAVADHLSFSKAAESCHITQSTLSNGLSELEDILGKKLFIRDTRKVALTPAGEDLIAPVHAILEQLTNLIHLSRRSREPLTSHLVLGIIPTIAPYLLPLLLPFQQKEYPNLDLQLREDLTSRQLEYLEKGRVDAVLMAFPYNIPLTEHLILWSEPFYLACTDNQAKKRKSLKIQDLSDETILLLEDGHCLRDHVISACQLSLKRSGSGIGHALGATSLQTLIQMVQHGYGATLLPQMAVRPELLPAGIKAIPFSSPKPSRQIGLVWRKNDPRAEEFRLLGRLIKKACSPLIS